METPTPVFPTQTAKVAILNDRNSVGYEVDSKILSTITAKIEKAKIDKAATVTVSKRP